MERKKKLLLPIIDLAKQNSLKITNIQCLGYDPSFIENVSLFISHQPANFLLILNQGENELQCLQKMQLNSFQYIYTAVYPHNLNQMDQFLKKHGFYREETVMTVEKYGETFYSRS
jgi:hypothetical protein